MFSRRQFILAAGALAACGGGGSKFNAPPAPAVQRKDILFGYYGDAPGQAAETIGHCNLYFSAPWGELSQTVENLKDARKAGFGEVVIAADADKGNVPGTTAFAWAWLFELRRLGALEGLKVRAFYWRDEPNLENPDAGLKVLSDARVREQNASLRAMLATDFPELGPVELWTIMADKPDLPGLDDWDAVGGDDYPKGCDVMADERLIGRIRRGAKRTILVPSPLFGLNADPTCFEQFAQAHGDVVAVMPFIWRDAWGPQRLDGIRSHFSRPAYEALGRRLTGK